MTKSEVIKEFFKKSVLPVAVVACYVPLTAYWLTVYIIYSDFSNL